MHSMFSCFVMLIIALAIATRHVGAVTCSCPPVPSGEPGVNAFLDTIGDPALQCSFDAGACTWNSVRRHIAFHPCAVLLTRAQTGQLLNPGQTNCQSSIPSGTTSCPPDLNGDSATATRHLFGFSCFFIVFIDPPDFPAVTCDWDVVGH